MDITSRRPWETQGATSQTQTQTTQTLPPISTLVPNMDPSPTERVPQSHPPSAARDSGSWSLPANGVANNSAYSTNTMPYLTSAQSPHRLSGQATSQPSGFASEPYAARSSGYTNGQHAHGLPSMNSAHDTTQHRGSGDFQDSRRSSVDSRMHQGMDRLALGPASPYGSANPSQASLHLQRERGIPSNYRGPRYSASGPISPVLRNSDSRGFVASRVAPPIAENPRPEVYNAAAPSAGQAYAFPDPDLEPSSSSRLSRRGSYASSLASSMYTIESTRLPPGQQELPTHHHKLQHQQINNILDDPDSPNSTTPYSRTPELRVTHKLAERKRRSEMKDCFELLRAHLPPSQGNKSSKWETLQRAIDHITALETKINTYRMENEKQRQQMIEMDAQMKDMSQQLQRMSHHGSYQTPPSAVSPSSHAFANHFSNGHDATNDPPRTLPPLMNGAMQGVQYSDDRR